MSAFVRITDSQQTPRHGRFGAHCGLKSDFTPCPFCADIAGQLEMKEAAN
jgi:hypothetical protein